MATDQQAPVSRKRRIGRSVEIQHGRRGVGLMFRRGLHGAKNWVLEPDEEGLPRSPWAKLLRVLVILTPVWIVLSAVTGGPERGGHQVGPGQAILSALVVTLVGLGFLSARERRLGREEPWAELPEIDTPSDNTESTTLMEPAPEDPTEVQENAQVSGVSGTTESADKAVTPGDIPDEGDQSYQVGLTTETPAVTPSETGETENPFVQVERGDHPAEAATQVVTAVDTEEIRNRADTQISDSLEVATPTVPLRRGNPPVTLGTVSLVKAESTQVSTSVEAVTEGVPGDLTSNTVSDGLPQPGQSLWSAVDVATPGVQEELFPQIAPPSGVATAEIMATAGPYPASDAPVADDWWLTKPDVASTAEESEAGTDTLAAEAAVEAVPEEAEAEPETEAADEGQSGVDLGLDPAVVAYLAVRSMPDATEELKEKTRQGAAQWARTEIEVGRLSQRGAAEVLRVSKTTVAKWLSRGAGQEYDPWADTENE